MRARIRKPGTLAVIVLACTVMISLGATAFSGASSAAGIRSVIAQKTPLFVEVEMVAANGQLANVYTAGTRVEFWIKVLNPATGDVPLTSATLKSVTVGLPNGKTLTAVYGKHSTDAFWVASWAIPASYPAGTVPYTVTAHAKNGAIGRYVPFNISASALTVAG